MDDILQAGLEVLATAGPAGLTTQAVADRAGLSVGALYRYFSNADDVVRAVYRRQVDEDLGFLEELARTHADRPVRELVEGIVRSMVDRHRTTAQLPDFSVQHLATWGLVSFDAGASERAEEILIGHMASRAGEVRPRDVEVATFILFAGLSGLLKTTVARRPELLERESFTREVVEVAIRYLLPPDAQPTDEE